MTDTGEPMDPRAMGTASTPTALPPEIEKALKEASDAVWVLREKMFYSMALQVEHALFTLRTALESGARDRQRLDWMQAQLHDVRDGSIGDVTLYGSWQSVSVCVGNQIDRDHERGKAPTLREAIDIASVPPLTESSPTAHE